MKHFFIVLFFAIFFSSCNSAENSSSKEQEEWDKRIKKMEIITQKLKKDYRILNEVDIINYKYTIHFNKAFIDSSYLFLMNSPIGVHDFLRRNGKYFVRSNSSFENIYCEVECEERMFNELLNAYNDNSYKDIILVIKPYFIEKLFLTANPENDKDINYIEIDYSSSYLLKGILITYRFID